jgi:hypothetical protein
LPQSVDSHTLANSLAPTNNGDHGRLELSTTEYPQKPAVTCIAESSPAHRISIRTNSRLATGSIVLQVHDGRLPHFLLTHTHRTSRCSVLIFHHTGTEERQREMIPFWSCSKSQHVATTGRPRRDSLPVLSGDHIIVSMATELSVFQTLDYFVGFSLFFVLILANSFLCYIAN